MKLIKPGMQDQEPIGVKVFLAGSIEMGSAEDWQSSLVEKFEDLAFLTLYNPRRDDWNSDWHADSREMIEQVNWEMNKLEDSDIIFMYFSPGTKSPISLLELGLHAASNIIVCCQLPFFTDGFCWFWHYHCKCIWIAPRFDSNAVELNPEVCCVFKTCHGPFQHAFLSPFYNSKPENKGVESTSRASDGGIKRADVINGSTDSVFV